MSIESKINIIVSIITCSTTIISLIIAVIALFQSNKQIKVSNKQNLFNERIKSYLIIKGLMQLYIDNKVTIEEDKKEKKSILKRLWCLFFGCNCNIRR